MKQKLKQTEYKRIEKIYKARTGAPFKSVYAQEIGEFVEKCKDKTTRGILKEIKKNPKHVIYSLFEWDKNKAAELYQLDRVREIVNHIDIKIIQLGNQEPVNVNISITAFRSVVSEDSNNNVYVSLEEGMINPLYRAQIIQRAKTELKNWMERYSLYQELVVIVNALKELLDKNE